MLTLFKNLPQQEADLCSLALSSAGIIFRIRKANGWDILVNDEDYWIAFEVVEQYLEDNPETSPPEETSEPEYLRTYTGIWAACILLAMHLFFSEGNNYKAYISACGASAYHIVHGELFRAVTALMLHSSVLHLAGNMIGIALFGTAVCSFTGWGLGWFMILFSGIFGNLLNAFLYKTGHLAIGASTAVFGAIGILCGYNFLAKFRQPGQRMKAWLPLGGGLALLGLFSAGENTDLMAHLLGLLAGLLLGFAYVHFFKERPGLKSQVLFMLSTVAIIAASWTWGLMK